MANTSNYWDAIFLDRIYNEIFISLSLSDQHQSLVTKLILDFPHECLSAWYTVCAVENLLKLL